MRKWKNWWMDENMHHLEKVLTVMWVEVCVHARLCIVNSKRTCTALCKTCVSNEQAQEGVCVCVCVCARVFACLGINMRMSMLQCNSTAINVRRFWLSLSCFLTFLTQCASDWFLLLQWIAVSLTNNCERMVQQQHCVHWHWESLLKKMILKKRHFKIIWH